MQGNFAQGNSTMGYVDDNDLLVAMVQDYARLLNAGEGRQAKYILQDICQFSDKTKSVYADVEREKISHTDEELYSKVGKLTRELHESINNFMSDDSLAVMTNESMPDARQRLTYVVELTEQSAHKTMTLIEHSNPLIRVMGERAGVLLKQYTNTEQDNPGFLQEEIKAFLHLSASTAKSVTGDLNEIMLAQNYQDLTGQVINRVSTLVQDVENNLLTLLRLSDQTQSNQTPLDKTMSLNPESKIKLNTDFKKEETNNKGFGPAVPGTDKGDVVQSQEDVDDLLSSLGF